MNSVKPAKTAPIKQTSPADTNTVPDRAKPVDINKTSQKIGSLFTQHGEHAIREQHKAFDRQQQNNQTFGYQ